MPLLFFTQPPNGAGGGLNPSSVVINPVCLPDRIARSGALVAGKPADGLGLNVKVLVDP
jgi:hypothetical protein